MLRCNGLGALCPTLGVCWKVDASKTPPFSRCHGESVECIGNNTIFLAALTICSSHRLFYVFVFFFPFRYAVHNPHVKFSCKKVGASKNDINTMARTKTIKGTVIVFSIRLLFFLSRNV